MTVAVVDQAIGADSPGSRSGGRNRGELSARVALGVFVTAAVVTFPLVLLRLGTYHWFFRDDWVFLTADDPGLAGLFEPHGEHLTAVPRAAFVVLWRLFGATTYLPYQAVVVTLHLSVVVLLRVIIRRAGVGPWLATAAAGALFLFGPGAQDIVWAFQIGFTGAIAFGLGAIVAADRDGPLGWRDAGAEGLALLALMSAGSAVPLVLALGGITLVRRGWRVAAALTAPLATVYLAWVLVKDPRAGSPFGAPSRRVVAEWVWSGAVGTFDALGHWTIVSVLLVAVLAAGLALAWSPPLTGAGGLRRRLALPTTLVTPVVLLAATAAFSTSTAWARWYTGSEGARASRYVYVLAALTLPALAVAAQALVSRWRVLVVPLWALFLVAVPHNVAAFEPNVFGENYMRERQRIATTAVRMPFAADVPSDVRPESDPYDGDLTIGFLLDAASEGRLEPSTFPITERVENEFRIRLGVAQRPIADPPTELATAMEGCETRAEPIVLTPPVGERIRITSTVTLVTVDERGEVTSSPVQRAPEAGAELSFELPDLRVRITPGARSATFTVCTP